MKTRSGLGDVVTTMILLLLGVALIYGNSFDRELGNALARVLDTQLFGFLLGVVMVLSVFLRWFGCLGQKRNKGFINFRSGDGSVGISTKAIQDFIVRVGREFSSIKSIESKLIQGRKTLDIDIKLKVLSGTRVPELSQVLQQRIRESVRESLGLEGIRNIAINVQEIVGDPRSKAPSVEEESITS